MRPPAQCVHGDTLAGRRTWRAHETIADTSRLQLEISVAESDIPNVSIGQSAEIAVDALPSRSFSGVVTAIAPVSDSSADAVSYPVTIQLTGGEQTGLMIGMNAVAALANTQTLAAERGVMPMGLGG